MLTSQDTLKAEFDQEMLSIYQRALIGGALQGHALSSYAP